MKDAIIVVRFSESSWFVDDFEAGCMLQQYIIENNILAEDIISVQYSHRGQWGRECILFMHKGIKGMEYTLDGEVITVGE